MDSTCTQGSPLTPIVSNITGQGVCGFASSASRSALESCCQGSAIQEFNCVQYCSPPQTNIRNFLDCLVESVGNNSVSTLSPFCQEAITRRDVNGLPNSAAFSTRNPPSLKAMLLGLVALGLLSNVQAAGHSDSSTALRPRQDSGCQVEIANNFTMSRQSQRVTGEFTCGGLCPYTFDIDTGLNNNNRTVNGTSAAGAEYDSLFDALQNQTGRSFPTLSSIMMKYGLVASAGSFFVDFTPLAWCANGTISGCDGVPGASEDGTFVTACGPLFISEYGESDEAATNGDAIQGTFTTVVSTIAQLVRPEGANEEFADQTTS